MSNGFNADFLSLFLMLGSLYIDLYIGILKNYKKRSPSENSQCSLILLPDPEEMGGFVGFAVQDYVPFFIPRTV